MPSFRVAFEPKVPIDDLAIAMNQAAELADRCAHSIDRGVVLPWVPWILAQPFNRPVFDANRCWVCQHTRTAQE
jgi:hypothetical protein